MTIWQLALNYKRPAAHLTWLRQQGFIAWNRSNYHWITQEGREYLASLDTQEEPA